MSQAVREHHMREATVGIRASLEQLHATIVDELREMNVKDRYMLRDEVFKAERSLQDALQHIQQWWSVAGSDKTPATAAGRVDQVEQLQEPVRAPHYDLGVTRKGGDA